MSFWLNLTHLKYKSIKIVGQSLCPTKISFYTTAGHQITRPLISIWCSLGGNHTCWEVSSCDVATTRDVASIRENNGCLETGHTGLTGYLKIGPCGFPSLDSGRAKRLQLITTR